MGKEIYYDMKIFNGYKPSVKLLITSFQSSEVVFPLKIFSTFIQRTLHDIEMVI